MAKCYIAGPMRGIPKYNFPAFFAAATYLRAQGWEVLSPAEMDMEEDVEDYAKYTLKQQGLNDTASSARQFATRDIGVILGDMRAEDGDIVATLPGWKGSVGAQAEVAVAKWVFLPVFELEEL